MEGLEIGVLNIKCFQHAYNEFVKPYQTLKYFGLRQPYQTLKYFGLRQLYQTLKYFYIFSMHTVSLPMSTLCQCTLHIFTWPVINIDHMFVSECVCQCELHNFMCMIPISTGMYTSVSMCHMFVRMWNMFRQYVAHVCQHIHKYLQ